MFTVNVDFGDGELYLFENAVLVITSGNWALLFECADCFTFGQ